MTEPMSEDAAIKALQGMVRRYEGAKALATRLINEFGSLADMTREQSIEWLTKEYQQAVFPSSPDPADDYQKTRALLEEHGLYTPYTDTTEGKS